MRIQIQPNEAFDKIIRDLEKLGYTKQEMVKAGIRLLHKKEYPPYAAKKIKKTFDETMTPEEIAEDVLGGEVIEEHGVKYVIWKEGNMNMKAPLSAIRDQLK